MLLRFLLLFSIVSYTACASGPKPMVEEGCTREDVRRAWGEPKSVVQNAASYGDHTVWMYETASVIFGDDARVEEIRFTE